VMTMNQGVRSCFRDRRFQQLLSMIEIGSKDGMMTFDESLAKLLATKQITKEEALLNARDAKRVLGKK
jgi:twitching motility protein PilT